MPNSTPTMSTWCPPSASERVGGRADRAIAWDRPVLIGCCPSSGSTLLSVMLDAHPDLLCGPELAILAHPLVWQGCGGAWRKRLLDCLDLYPSLPPREQWNLDHGAVPYQLLTLDDHLAWYGLSLDGLKTLIVGCDSVEDLVRGMLGPALVKRQKRLWAEKSPPNVYSMPLFLERYPEGKAIVMVRDGRDVVCSLLQRGFSLCEACSIWLFETTLGLMLRGHPRVRLIRYEDLVVSPGRVLADLNEFLELPAAGDSQLRYREHSDRVASDLSLRVSSWTNMPTAAVSSSAVGRWKRDLAAAQLEVFYRHRLRPGMQRPPGFAALPALAAADLLKALNYEPPAAVQSLPVGLIELLVRERPFSSHSRGARGLHRCGTELVLGAELCRQVLADSQAALDVATAAHDAAAADLRDTRLEIEVLKTRLAVAEQRSIHLEDSARQSENRAAAAESALNSVYSSRGWRMLQRLRRCRALVAKARWM